MSDDRKKSDNPSLSGIAQMVSKAAGPIIQFLSIAIPLVIVNVGKLYDIFSVLPQNTLSFLYGTIICFFGGTFPTLFASLEAAKHAGRQTVFRAVSDLAKEAMIIIEESKKDDDADEDGDGKKDVKQISSRELLSRKFKLVMKKMNPDKIDNALGSMYKVWLSVAAVLKIQFARTISLALSIAEFLERPMDRFVAPVLRQVTPQDYQKWVPVLLSWCVKAVAMSIAWYLQRVISATASALTGGLLMARAFYQWCLKHKFTLFGLIPENHEDTSADEIMSYLFAGLGLYTQFQLGFALPFPLNIILWPFQVTEYYIRWLITD